MLGYLKAISALLLVSKLALVQSKATLPLSTKVCGEGVAICDGLCCGQTGYCGVGLSFCGTGCQEGYGLCFHPYNGDDTEEVTADLTTENEDSISDDDQTGEGVAPITIPAIPLDIEGIYNSNEIPAIPLKVEGLFPDPPIDFDVKKEGVAYGEVSKVSYYSKSTNTEKPAIVITPPNYDTAKKYPVLYLCHGENGDENDFLNININETYSNLLSEGKTKPMIIVLTNNKSSTFENEFSEDLMTYIESNYSVLTGRENTAIAGFSMGGKEALNIGIKRPDLVSYIGAFSPSQGIIKYSDSEEGLFTEETFALPKEYIDDTFCLIVSGKNDSVVGLESMIYHKILVANGFEGSNYYYDISGDHDSTVLNHGLYNFLTILFN